MTLPPRWERFLSEHIAPRHWDSAKAILARVLAEHDAERAGPTLPAEQPAPTCEQPCDHVGEPWCAKDAQAAPDGERLSERIGCGKVIVRRAATEITCGGGRAFCRSCMDALAAKLAEAQREREEYAELYRRTATADAAVANERARCIAWIQKAEWLFEAFAAIRDGRPAPTE